MGIFTSIFGGNALKKAAKKNIAQATEARDRELGYVEPYADAGDSALKAYLDSIGQGDSNAAMTAFEASPAYQLNYNTAIEEGRRGVEGTAQSEGSYNSGRTLKALQDRGQETSRGFFSDYLKGLSGVADMGYNAAGAKAGISQGGTRNIMGGNDQLANAKVSQYAGFDNLLSSGLKAISGFMGGGAPTSFY